MGSASLWELRCCSARRVGVYDKGGNFGVGHFAISRDIVCIYGSVGRGGEKDHDLSFTHISLYTSSVDV
jgi:hypothetical protein